MIVMVNVYHAWNHAHAKILIHYVQYHERRNRNPHPHTRFH